MKTSHQKIDELLRVVNRQPVGIVEIDCETLRDMVEDLYDIDRHETTIVALRGRLAEAGC